MPTGMVDGLNERGGDIDLRLLPRGRSGTLELALDTDASAGLHCGEKEGRFDIGLAFMSFPSTVESAQNSLARRRILVCSYTRYREGW